MLRAPEWKVEILQTIHLALEKRIVKEGNKAIEKSSVPWSEGDNDLMSRLQFRTWMCDTAKGSCIEWRRTSESAHPEDTEQAVPVNISTLFISRSVKLKRNVMLMCMPLFLPDIYTMSPYIPCFVVLV